MHPEIQSCSLNVDKLPPIPNVEELIQTQFANGWLYAKL